ncbi:uncharacterized protein LOC110183130 [Drosophila serrata]|uniref:uncharacterized protein LOC110183130 n=1 Tax=Drosophila serrata TaxID=7274 RepID=UPI000A1CFE87|nr:uncharacterized protein LOC110183130 [Drosophila serrata]KAH8391606.1 hypothetical protein KR200_009076 [Drosophila serrata]
MPTLKMTIGLPSRRTLGSLCIFGALASISGLAYMRWRLEDQVRRMEYYQMAIQQLRQHSGAVDLLGEPIRESGFNLSNEKNRCDADKAHLQVSVQGSKDKGTVYFWATNNQKKGWLIDRLELETKQHPNTRYLLKKPTYTLVSSDGHDDSDDVNSEKPHEVAQKQDKKNEESAPPSIQNHPLQQMRQQEGQEPIPFVQTSEGGSMK